LAPFLASGRPSPVDFEGHGDHSSTGAKAAVFSKLQLPTPDLTLARMIGAKALALN
jgi:hypothetical protein